MIKWKQNKQKRHYAMFVDGEYILTVHRYTKGKWVIKGIYGIYEPRLQDIQKKAEEIVKVIGE